MPLLFACRRWIKQCVDALNRSKAGSARKRRRRTRAPLWLEQLEDRLAPSAVSWTGNAGTLNWADANNWSNNLVPTSADDVTISKAGIGTINIGAGSYAVHSLNDSTAGLSIASGGTLSLAAVAATSTFGQNVTVQSGGTLAVGAGASVVIPYNVTLTDSGTATFNAGDAVSFSYVPTAPIVVTNGGVLNASNTAFTGYGPNNLTQIYVDGGGRFTASNSSFTYIQVYLDNGSILNAGDFVGNSFNANLFLSATDVQYLSGAGSNNAQFQDIDILAGTLTSGQTLALNAIGTASTANLLYVFAGNFTVSSGATLTVAANVSVVIPYNVTLTDSGTATFNAGDAVSFSYVPTAPIVVTNGGVLNASNTAFTGYGANNLTQIYVDGGGRFTASNSSFTYIQVYLDNGSILNAGDFVGNSFNANLFLSAADVQYLSGAGSNNAQFNDIDILAGTLTSGTLALNAIGTASTANLLYVFAGNFTVSSGATLTVAANVSVVIPYNVTLTDSGTATFNAGDAVSFSYVPTAPIVVTNGGVLNASNTAFTGYGPNNLTQIYVDGGGHFTASNSSFTYIQVYLDNGSILNAGDFVGNSFNANLFLSATDVQYLSGAGSNNAQFQDIDILAGTLTSGTLALNAIGTASTANLLYVFSGNFTVSSGATLTVAANVKVAIAYNVTLTDSGTATFNAGDAVSFSYAPTAPIVVTNGGVLNASNTAFTGYGANNLTQIYVGSGGHFTASNSSFTYIQVYLDNGSILNAGDFVGNSFNTNLSLPAADVQYLSGAGSNNAQFNNIDILAGTLTSGQTLALNAIGTASTANLLYVFAGNFTVSSGATLTVAANVSMVVGSGATLADNGTLTFAKGDAVTLAAGTTIIAVNNGGVMNASNTNFSGNSSYDTQVIVNPGGQLTANSDTFALNNVTLAGGSTDTIQFSSFATQLAINSGASITINSDDLSSANATVVASGNSTATINLENNYWGTTVTAQITAKITDRNSAPVGTRPLVLYSPFLSAPAQMLLANPQSVTTNLNVAKAITLTSTDPNGDPLTFQVTDPSSGTLTGSGASRTYTPNAGFSGGDSFTFTVTDTTTGLVSNTATVSITVMPPPVANSQSVTTNVNVAKAIALTSTDPNGDLLTFLVTSGPSSGTLTGSGASRTYTPNSGFRGSDSFTFTVTDTTTGLVSNTATVSITVTPAPVANNQSVTTNEGAAKAITLTSSDPNGDPLTFQVTSGPSGGTLTGSGASRTYTPNGGFSGSDSFAFTATDTTTGLVSNTATVSITVTPAPVANNQSVTTNPGVAKGITLTSTDPNSDPLTYQITSSPSNGTLTGSGASRTYTPNAGFMGSDSFAFTVTDTTTGLVSNTATVSIIVSASPVANGQSVTTNQGVAKAIALTSTDPNGDPLTFLVTSGPSSGTLTGSGASRIYTPNAGFSGSDSFKFTATDTTTGLVSNTATVSITVTPAPVANNQSATTNPGVAKAITLTSTDPNGDPLTFQVTSGPSSGTLTGSGASRTYTPNTGFSGSDSFKFTVTDATTGLVSNTATVIETVTPAPVANNQSATTNPGVAKAITLTSTDPNGDPLTFQVTSGPSSGTLTGSGASRTYTPNTGFSGSDSFAFTVTDTTTGLVSNIATVSITVSTLTAVSWTGDAGTLNWGDANNWSNNAVPGSADDVTISKSGVGTINISGASFAVHSLNDTTAALSIASGATLSLAAFAPSTSTFGQNVTVQSGGTLAVGAGASVVIPYNVTLTDSGTATFNAGDAVSFSYVPTAPIVVTNGGVLNASNTAFTGYGPNNLTQIYVDGGGRFTASNSSFTYIQVYLDNGSILNAGDFVGNSFNANLFLSATDVQYLSGAGSNNAQFQDIDILAGTLTSGQTLALNAIGTASTANLLYVFAGNFTVSSGATLTVAANVSVVIPYNVTLTDSGTATFNAGDAVSFSYVPTAPIVVTNGGVLNASNTAFTGYGPNNLTQIYVDGGGHFTASNSSFTYIQVYLDNGSILNAGDFVGNSFNANLFLSATDVQYLSGAGSNNAQFQDIDILAGTLTSGQTLALNAIGTASTANLLYVFAGNFTVSSGATLTVAANVSVVIPYNVTLTDSGTATFNAGDAVSFSYVPTAPIVVTNGGVLNASNTAFTGYGPNNLTQIYVDGGGRFTASNSSFTYIQVYLDNGSILNAGDFVGNSFNANLFLSAADVQYLSGAGSNNAQFNDIDILAGTLTSGTLALNAIGTASTANLLYVFAGNFTVSSGATLTVAANVSVVIPYNVTLTDSGTATFNAGDAVSFSYVPTAPIVVTNGGVLNASNTAFTGYGPNNLTQIYVDGGGHFTASNSSFTYIQVYLDNGSILNAGDFVGNSFNANLFLSATDVQYLSGAGSNNAQFQDIDILAGTLTSGQTLALNAIGTASTANLLYVFAGNFTVSSGATLTVAANVSVVIPYNVTLTDSGTATFNAGDAVSFSYVPTAPIVVTNGGVLNASNTAFTGYGPNNLTQIYVDGGGHFTASNSSFTYIQVYLDNGSILNAGDFVGNSFNANLFLSATDVQYLSGAGSNNAQFQDIDILAGTLTSGTLALNAIGTASTANLLYVFSGNFTVSSGATLTVAANVSMVVGSGATLADNGTLTFAKGDAVTLAAGTTIIAVNNGGVMNASNTNFSGNSSYDTQVIVNPGGQLTANSDTFALNNVTLAGGSTDTIQFSAFASQLAINSGAFINISSNDFSSVATNGIIASGDPNATIDLPNNYWGTTVPTQIAAKILDHLKDATRPTVVYPPIETAEPVETTAAPVTTTFSSSAQNVTLNAVVNSPSGTVNQGTETFTILNGATVIGTPVTVSVSADAASTVYTLPAGTPGGIYTIEDAYNGTSIFLAYTDTSQFLTIHAAASATAAASASSTFSTAGQNVTLNATVTSSAGVVNEGTETFYILNGTTIFGTPVTVNVSAGAASAVYALPASMSGGTYTVEAVYNGTADFLGYTDASQSLVVNAAASATAAASASSTFDTAGQDVTLNATVTSAAGVVDEGAETFTVLNGTTVIGTPVTVNVSAGAASAVYLLPAGASAGTYIIQAVYNGTTNFLGYTDSSQSLIVNAAASATAAASASSTFSGAGQNVTLNATITSDAGVVKEGSETFTILNGTTVIGSPVTVNVSAGAASVVYALPAGLPGGTYIIQAVYNGTTNFLGYTDNSQSLIVSAAASASAAAGASATFSGGGQNVTLNATITSDAGVVNEGTETFTILNGTTVIGSPVTVNVSAGTAAAAYALPAATGAGTYIIQAVYNGTTNFLGYTDSSQVLTVSAAATATAAGSASATFSGAGQNVTLNATITSDAGVVNEGTETFTILNGTTVIGSPVTVNVSTGAAAAAYALPAGTRAGTYIIQAVYNGTTNFLGYTDSSQVLTVSAAATATAAASASATFSGAGQNVTLNATVTSAAGMVNEGTETFTILNGATVVGSPVTVNVSAGAAAAAYALPAGAGAGTYIIQAVYNGTTNFLGYTDSSQVLTISAAATATAAASASATYSGGGQNVTLNATITSDAGVVDEGTETFTVLNGATVIGSPVTVNASAGAAAAAYALPAGTGAGTYIIQAIYNGTSNFLGYTDGSHFLTVSAAASATAAASASAIFSGSDQNVTLNATVTSAAGTVNEGTETFTILNGTTVISSPVTVNVSAGAAAVAYVLPGDTPAGTYIIQAVYNGTANFLGYTDSSQSLTVSAAATATAAANASATFSSAAQNVTLNATVTSAAGTVNEGTETFTILNGAIVIGSPVTINVSAGAAAAVYALPAGTGAGTYVIQAVYNGTTNFLGYTDSSQVLTVSAAATATAVASASATFNGAAQNVTLNATVTSAAGTVNEGTETYTILNGTTVVGSPVTVNVSAGAVAAVYVLPGRTPAGSYVIQAVYNGTTNFLGYTDGSHFLTVGAAAAATAAASASATFSGGTQNVTLNATVTSAAGTVNEGTETFTILSGTTVIGSPVTVNVSAGAAAAVYVLPGDAPASIYVIQAVYNGTVNFGGDTDSSHDLTVSAAASATAAASASAIFSTADQNLTLNATVTSGAGVVNEGTETFSVLNGTTVIGSPVTVNVSAGAAAAAYALPAGTGAGTYIIQAIYNGTSNFLGYTDNSHFLTVSAAASATAAANASAIFSGSDQNVTLNATVTSAAGTVNEGTETFTILNGTTVISSPVTVNVSAGAAAAAYVLPGATPAGTYIIQAVYNGTSDFLGYTDSSHFLTVSAAATATAAASASATFSGAAQNVTLNATVTSAAGTVNEGTETFTILNGTTVIASPVTGNVSAGAAAAAYALPAGTGAGTYVIQAVYNGTTNFLGYTDSSHFLTVSAAASATAAASASATFNGAAQNVTLNATVTSAAGTVNEGTETFTILNGTTVIASPVTVNVSAGAAAAVYVLPGGTPAGAYVIQAVFNGTTNFLGYTDGSHFLTVGAAAAATAAASASATFSGAGQNVTLNAAVTSAAGTVNEGTETFTILNGTTVIGSPVTVNVSAGAAAAVYVLPGGTPASAYVIQAVYNGTVNFGGDTDSGHYLTVSAAASATAAASASATFSTSDQDVTLNATVTSAAGVVNEGTETFTILNGTTVIGTPVTVNVTAGATAVYVLPGGTPAAAYTIQAVYNGTPNFLGDTDASHLLTIGAAATATAAANASAPFNSAAQAVALSATVTSAAGTVNEGTETFTILSGATPIGTPVTVNVASGAAASNYSLPGGTPAGSYTIEAVYNGGPDFAPSNPDATHALTVAPAGTTTTTPSASPNFSPADQVVPLSATVTSPAGAVQGGAVTFTLLNGSTPIGTPVVSPAVANGQAGASYTLPGGTPAGSYMLQAAYSGDPEFAPSTTTAPFVVNPATTVTTATNATAVYSPGDQSVPLSAGVSSPSGPVNEGTVTFTVLNGSTQIGAPITAPVSGGAASAPWTLPGGTPAGSYTIEAVYNGGPDFAPSNPDATHALTVAPAGTTTTTPSASPNFSPADQVVPLSATVTSPAGAVQGGAVTFTLLNGSTPIGTPVVSPAVANGQAGASYTLPGGTPAGSYMLQAAYSGDPEFAPSTTTAPFVVNPVNQATVTAVSVDWGIESALLQTAADGVRLLPVGRHTDLPWFNINRIAITLSQAATVNAGDVSVTGISGGSYGPVTISGSGTTNILITLARAVSGPDRLTLTIGNSQIITYTRRLDILPGDANDDGYVNTTDGVLILNNETPAHAYQAIYDMNGDGTVTMADFTLYRPAIGTTLPALPPQLAAGGEEPGGAAPLTPDEVNPVLTAAVQQWEDAGLPAQDVARLESLTVQITNLPAGYLGTTAIGGDVIYLSADAAGYGWFIDPTPWTDAPFAHPAAATELLADPSAAAAGHEDLLTVLMHEMGHALGLSDLDPANFSTDLMAETLATGVQRLPSAQDVAAAIATQHLAGPAAPLTMPTLPTSTAVADAVFAAAGRADSGVPPSLAFAPIAIARDSLYYLMDALAPLSAPVIAVPGDGEVPSKAGALPATRAGRPAVGTATPGLTNRTASLAAAINFTKDDTGAQPDPWGDDFPNSDV